MTGQYRFSRLRYIFIAAFFAMIVPAAAPAMAQDDPLYTIEGIHVDVTAESAVSARTKAFEEAQQKAFAELAARLATDGSAGPASPPPAGQVAAMVNDYEITQEQLSSVRYVGTYTFRFRPDAVRHYLGARNVPHATVSARPVLMLPYIQSGSRTVIWSEDNPWFDAWRRSGTGGIVPFVVPLGDAGDFAAMQDDHALDYNPTRLRAMAARYDAGNSAIAIATPAFSPNDVADGPVSLSIALYRTDRGSAEFVHTLKIDAASRAAGESIYDAGVRAVRDLLSRDWKSRAASVVEAEIPVAETPMAATGSINASVRFRDAGQWLDMQRAIRRAPGVVNMRLISLKPQEALIAIDYAGDPSSLRAGLPRGVALGSGSPAPARASSYNPNATYNPDAAYVPPRAATPRMTNGYNR